MIPVIQPQLNTSRSLNYLLETVLLDIPKLSLLSAEILFELLNQCKSDIYIPGKTTLYKK